MITVTDSTVDECQRELRTSRQVGRFTERRGGHGLSLLLGQRRLRAREETASLRSGESPVTKSRKLQRDRQGRTQQSHTADIGGNRQHPRTSTSRETITLPAVQPQAGTTFTATLADHDGPTAQLQWSPRFTTSRGRSGTGINNADSQFLYARLRRGRQLPSSTSRLLRRRLSTVRARPPPPRRQPSVQEAPPASHAVLPVDENADRTPGEHSGRRQSGPGTGHHRR